MEYRMTIDKLFSYEDTKLKKINNLLTKIEKVQVKVPQKCKLLSTATQFINKSRKSCQEYIEEQKDYQSISGNSHNDKKNTKKKKKHLDDITENKSYIDESTAQNIILLQNYMQQPKVVLKYLEEKDPQEFYTSQHQKQILKNWILCLNRQDRMEIEKQRTWFPNPRNIQLRHINSGLNQIYGVGVKRRLRPGEQATIIQSIEKFLNECNKNINQIAFRDATIHQMILSWAQLEDLINYPFCMKQIQTHFKIMATRWRYNGKHNLKNKLVQRAILTGHSRGHFLDLSKKDNLLVKYLLEHSKTENLFSETQSRGTIGHQTVKRKGVSFQADRRINTIHSQLKN